MITCICYIAMLEANVISFAAFTLLEINLYLFKKYMLCYSSLIILESIFTHTLSVCRYFLPYTSKQLNLDETFTGNLG